MTRTSGNSGSLKVQWLRCTHTPERFGGFHTKNYLYAILCHIYRYVWQYYSYLIFTDHTVQNTQALKTWNASCIPEDQINCKLDETGLRTMTGSFSSNSSFNASIIVYNCLCVLVLTRNHRITRSPCCRLCWPRLQSFPVNDPHQAYTLKRVSTSCNLAINLDTWCLISQIISILCKAQDRPNLWSGAARALSSALACLALTTRSTTIAAIITTTPQTYNPTTPTRFTLTTMTW